MIQKDPHKKLLWPMTGVLLGLSYIDLPEGLRGVLRGGGVDNGAWGGEDSATAWCCTGGRSLVKGCFA